MQPITQITGKAIPLAMNDVDTDLIIPAQHLTSTSRQGYGEYLFHRLRTTDANFVFNQPQFADGNILISEANFGCGSSREHAVWALQEAGIKAIIAISFSDIFAGNCAKNHLVTIVLPENIVNKMLQDALLPGYQLTIDIAQQQVVTSQGENFAFHLDPFLQHCLTHGLDDLNYLLSHQQQIQIYKEKMHAKNYCCITR